MATGKRRPLHPSSGSSGIASSGNIRSNHLNFRPSTNTEDRGGTRPTSTPSSIGLVLVTMVLHVCKKWLLFDTRLRVAIYLGALFLISIVTDFIPIPRSYFARTDSIVNQVFVKWAWLWLLCLIIPWVTLTAYILCCGRRIFLMKHLSRTILATIAWSAWTTLFRIIENNFGRCLNTRDSLLQTKPACLLAGRFWSGLDVSGHAFILVYASLILAEEGSTLLGWEGITDLITREEHTRNTQTEEASSRPLRSLSTSDLAFVKKAHHVLTPYLRGLFIAMTLQQLLCDFMLATTILYFHSMVEKFLGGLAAVLTWYLTYHWWYKLPKMIPYAPSEGLFKYKEFKSSRDGSARVRRNTLNSLGPRFMGMPLRINQEESQNSNRQTESDPNNFRD